MPPKNKPSSRAYRKWWEEEGEEKEEVKNMQASFFFQGVESTLTVKVPCECSPKTQDLPSHGSHCSELPWALTFLDATLDPEQSKGGDLVCIVVSPTPGAGKDVELMY